LHSSRVHRAWDLDLTSLTPGGHAGKSLDDARIDAMTGPPSSDCNLRIEQFPIVASS
jgi:hypothetical protein